MSPFIRSVMVTPPTFEPITLDEAKLAAGLDWIVGDPRDGQMLGLIAAARGKVESDTGLALPQQTRDVYIDWLADRRITLPAAQCLPLQAVTSIKWTDRGGTVRTIDPTTYDQDLVSGRIALLAGASWPTDLQPFQRFAIRIVSGYPSAAALRAAAPGLSLAVAMLTAHYATAGRDAVQVGHVVATTPLGYEDTIAPWRVVTLP